MTRLFPSLGRLLLTVVLLVVAAIALLVVWRHYQLDPWTRDGTIQADVVRVASDVSGLVTEVRIHDNQPVQAGDVLLTVDEERYQAKLTEAKASVLSALGSVGSAEANVQKAEASLIDSLREERRYRSLGDLVSAEEREQKITKARQDRATLAEATASVVQSKGSLAQAKASEQSAQIDVERSRVRAGVSGYVTNFSLKPGDYLSAGSSQFALVDSNSFYVLGYFEETKLHHFRLGDRARINLLGDSRPLWGHVDSLAAGIADRQQNPSSDLLPNVTPTFSWIRLAQRVPVRVVIDRTPIGIRLVAGRTATVTILPTLSPVPPSLIPASTIAPNTAPMNRPPSATIVGQPTGPRP